MSKVETTGVETPDSYEEKPAGLYWHEQLDHADSITSGWEDRGKKVVERYRDERDAIGRLKSKFNILWSNVQVLSPSLYGRAAKPEVSRRYMDSDPVGRLASTMLERVLEYETQQFPDFDSAMNSCVEDRLLCGRGTPWVRFEPTFSQVPVPTDAIDGVQIESTAEPPMAEEIQSVHSPVDYVYWKDFQHSPARIWDEVWWVARWAYLDRDEGVERFGDVFKNVPLQDYHEDNSKKSKDRANSGSFVKKAKVAEIWNKRTGRVCWIAKDYPQALDEREDPLHLEGFFPCPKPLYATMTNGSLIPVPDYCEYEDQARELDNITGRITQLVKTIKAVGVFNGEFKELTRMLSEGIDNKLFPVMNWAGLAEKGGLKSAVELLDLSTQIQALGVLYKSRDTVIQTIYQISGISDVMRGDTKAEETLGAQQLKANFGSLRLRKSQTDVARFASDIFRLKAQIICQFYPGELIVKMSGISDTDDGKNPQLIQAALALLSNGAARDFHISVESDSLAQIDDAAEKAAANEAVTAIGSFIKEAFPMAQSAPATLPMVSEMLLFLTRRYRAGRGLESAIEQTMKKLAEQAAQAAANPQPSEAEKEAMIQQKSDQMRIAADVQASAAKAQQDAQVQGSKLQTEAQLEQMKMHMDQQSRAFEARLEKDAQIRERQFELLKAFIQARTSIEVAEIGKQTTLQSAQISAANAGASE